MVVNYFGPERGVGAGYTWTSEDWSVGSGRWEITDVDPGTRVTIGMVFGDGDPAHGEFQLKPDGENTALSWVLETDMGWNPFNRIMGMFIEMSVATMYEEGLEKLNTIMAARPQWHIESIEEQESPAFSMLSIREKISPSAIGEMLGRSYGTIVQYVNSAGLEVSAPPFAIYHHWPQDGVGEADVEAAIPISAPDNGTTAIRGSQFNGGSIVVAHFYGPYEKSEHAHTALSTWAEENAKELVGAPWEIYVTDPQLEPDPALWLTLICYRVQSKPAL